MLMSKRVKIRVPNRLGYSGQSFDDLWPTLQDAIDHIYEGNVEVLSFEKLYRTVYSIVIMKKGRQLYTELGSFLTYKLQTLRERTIKDGSRGFELLQTLIAIWDSQCSIFKLISDMMIYLDKVYCKPERTLEVYDLCLSLFKKHVIDPLSQFVDQALITDINGIRSQLILNEVNTGVCKRIVDMMETLLEGNDNYFLNHFEPIFLESTRQYYEDLINNSDLDPTEYLDYMNKHKVFEFSLDEQFLNSDTVSKITTSLDKVLLWNQKFSTIVPILVHQAVIENNVELLNNICNLSSENEYTLKIIKCIENCLAEDANAITIETATKKKTQVAIEWTKAVFSLANKYQKLIEGIKWPSSSSSADGKNEELGTHIVDNVLSKFLNQNCRRSIEYISLYLDSCFKITKDKDEERKVMQNLSEAVRLFNLPAEKDFFEMLYKQQLSKRLLQGRSMIHLEKWMLQRIKDEVGTFFTSRLYGMLKDVSTSQEQAAAFIDANGPFENLETLDFRPQILTGINWPFKAFDFSDSNFYLPSKLEQLKLDFELNYNNQYPERKLTWAYHLCQLEIGFQFENSYHDISMSMFAASIFLLFEEHEELTTEMIGILTHLPEQELQRQLLSLSIVPKTKILRKKPMSKTINPQDKFSINYSFSSPSKNVKIQTIASIKPSMKNDATSKYVQDTLEHERVIEINAAITRKMKSSRSLTHGELSEQITEAVKGRFALTNSILKKSINYLLEKEYIQRDPDDSSVYHYLP